LLRLAFSTAALRGGIAALSALCRISLLRFGRVRG